MENNCKSLNGYSTVHILQKDKQFSILNPKVTFKFLSKYFKSQEDNETFILSATESNVSTELNVTEENFKAFKINVHGVIIETKKGRFFFIK
jgi:NACalpha-BTF3-like transcription factor